MAKTKNKSTASMENIYSLDGRVPLLKSIPFGLQHVLAMFVANIAPIMIVTGACGLSTQEMASLIQTAMIMAGIGTMVQLFTVWKLGAKLPIVMGISFTFVSVFCYVGPQWGYEAVIGAVIVGGIIEGLLGLFAKYWRGIIAPIVSACVATAIGFSLLSVGANSFAGGVGAADFGGAQNWILGTVTLVACILFNVFAKGHLKQLSVLVGLVVGYIVALFMGKVDLSSLEGVALISLPQIMPYKPVFNINAIISVVMIFLVSATETVGDTSAMTNTVLGREATEKEISGSLACDGLISSLSACFDCMPITSFSQNVGLICTTKVVSRRVFTLVGVVMLLAGICPKFSALMATIPQSVLGGATLTVFAAITMSGIELLNEQKMSYRNKMIVGVALAIGVGIESKPEILQFLPQLAQNILGSSLMVSFLVVFLLNILVPDDEEEVKTRLAL